MYLQIDDEFDKELKDAEYFDINQSEKLISFGPISTVNLFVGANNSGKSRFLRQLLKTNDIISSNNKFFVKHFIDTLKIYLKNKTDEFYETITINVDSQTLGLNAHKLKSFNPILYKNIFTQGKLSINLNAGTISNLHSKIDSFNGKNSSITELLREIKSDYETVEFLHNIKISGGEIGLLNSTGVKISITNSWLLEKVNSVFLEIEPLFKEEITDPQSYQKIYIPILRTSHSLYGSDINSSPLQKVGIDIFKSTVAKHYKMKEQLSHNVEIFTGLDLYSQIRKYRNNLKKERVKFEEFEQFIGVTFFNDDKFEIIARGEENDEERHINVRIHGTEDDIHNIGDGIQSLMLLLFPIFIAEPKTWIFIEEPEINLHPSMQRIFLEQLTTNPLLKEKNLKYFITTHSNHLLDLSLEMDEEVSIFTFNKTTNEEGFSRFNIKNVKSGNTEILDLLGVKTSSVFLANCTLWVEGITDRYYIRTFLKAFYDFHNNKENSNEEKVVFKEDLHYAFFEYAGSNIEHYMFEEPKEIFVSEPIKAQFLSNRILLVADKDKGKESRHLKKLLAQHNNFKFEILGVREIENLLSEKELARLLPIIYSKFRQDVDFKKLKFADYKTEYLASYLKSIYKSKVGSAFIAKSGTIKTKYKIDLAMAAKNNLKWDEMSEPAQNLTKNIYDFIKKSNT